MGSEIVLQVLVNGILMGGIYALTSIGLTLIWGVLDVINFAQGEMVMLGMYMSLLLVTQLGIDPLICILTSFVILLALGMLIGKVAIEPIMDSPRLYQLVVTIALSLVLQNLAFTFFGPENRALPKIGSLVYLRKIAQIGFVRISLAKMLPLPFSICLTLLLHYFLTRTKLGLAIRAVAQNRYSSWLVGIDVRRIYMITWALGISFAGMAGSLLILFHAVYPYVGTAFSLIAIISVCVGGMGSYTGAFAGAMIMGIVEALGGYIVAPAVRQVIYLSIFVIILIIRPKGIIVTR